MPSESGDNPSHQQIKSGGKGNPPNDKTGGGTPVTRSVIQIPNTVLEEYRTNQKKNERENKINRWIACTAVVGAWLAAAIMIFQTSEMIKTTSANRLAAEAASAGAKAWIAWESWKYHGRTDRGLHFSVIMNNVGQTPATAIQMGWVFAFYANRRQKPAFKSWECPPVKEGKGIARQNDPWNNNIFYNRPSQDGFTIEEQSQMIAERKGTMFILGCVKYHDVLGNSDRITQMAVYYPPADNGDGFTIYPQFNQLK